MICFSRSGFSIIELIIVILIIGLLLSVGLPRFMSIGISNSDKFIACLNKITLEGTQKAQKFKKTYKVFINFVSRKIELIQHVIKQDVDVKPEDFEIFPSFIEIEDFLIDNKSQFASSFSSKKSAYFLINPDGITQNTKIIFKDNNSKSKKKSYEIVLNPFISQFKLL